MNALVIQMGRGFHLIFNRHIGRPIWRGIILFLAIALSCNSLHAADVIVYVVGKNHHFDQFGAGAPTENPFDTWEAGASVYPTTTGLPGSVTNAAVTLAGTGTVLLGNQIVRWELSEYFDLKASLDSTAPNGTYKVIIGGSTDGVKTNTLQLTGDAYPAAPHMTNYAAAQVIKTSTNFALKWAPFATGTTNDFILLVASSSSDSSGTNYFITPLPNQAGALRGTNTHVIIPEGTLPTNDFGFFKLAFLKVVDRNTNDYPGVTGYAGYGAVTTMGFATLGFPTVSQPPVNIVTNVGANVSFSVLASGGVLTYQWSKDGTNIVNATNATLSLFSVRSTNAGTYRVVISNPVGTVTNTAFLTILTTPGSLDGDFNVGGAGANDFVRTLALRPDGRIVVGGSFTTFNGILRNRITLLEANGKTAASFNPASGANNVIYAVVAQAENKVIVGGSFNSIEGFGYAGVARYNANGTLDNTGFNVGTGANGAVLALALQPDNKVLLGGSFTSINGTNRDRVARLNADGKVDTNFVASCNNDVQAVVVQPDGRILIAGAFTAVNGTNRAIVARLFSSGALDPSFVGPSNINNRAYNLALQPDGKVLVCGTFNNVDGFNPGGVMRLNSDGSRDTSFKSGTGAPGLGVRKVLLQPDNRIWFGGDFTGYDGLGRARYVRAHPDGTADVSLTASPGANNLILNILQQPDGKILIGGGFTTVNGTTVNNLARLNGDALPPTPSLVYEPPTQYAFAGENASFYVGAACSQAVSYQWRSNGVSIPGATNASISFPSAQAAYQADYSVFVQSASGSVTSSNAALVVLPQPQLLEHIAHRYAFNESAGATTAADSIGTAHGQLLTPGLGDGFNGAGRLVLNGTSGYVNLPNGIISSLTNTTIEAWVTWQGPTNSQHQKIFDFGSTSAGEGNPGQAVTTMQFTPYSEFPNARFLFSTNLFVIARPTIRAAPLAASNEVHVAVVYFADASYAKLYVNGRLASMGGAPSPLRGINDINNWLGRSNGTAPNFNGAFNEFRIYDAPLSDAAILNSYLAGPEVGRISFTASGSTMTLSWPHLTAGTYILECTTNLAVAFQTFSYTATTNVAAVTVSTTIPTTGMPKYFRLHKL